MTEQPSPSPSPQPAPPPASAQPGHPHDDCDCKPGECQGQTLKKGLPISKEWQSLLIIVLIGLTTVLAALLIQAKRQQLTPGSPAASSAQSAISTVVPNPKAMSDIISLPKPRLKGTLSVEQALAERRSRREFSTQAVTMAELGQVLWAAQGITDNQGHRTAPSARNLYPYTMYVVVRNVQGIKPGLYQYIPDQHALGNLGLANASELLISANVQDNSQKAPVVLAMTASYGKMVEKFPDDPKGVAQLEGGHIGQNIYLQLEALGMGGVVTAGFNPATVGSALKLDAAETVVYLIPFGHRAPTTSPSPSASSNPSPSPSPTAAPQDNPNNTNNRGNSNRNRP